MTTTPDGYDEMRSSVAVYTNAREVVEAVGEDTVSFLQGQLSQDIAAMAIGTSTWSLLLAPQGKIDAWIRVTRAAEDRFLLDVDTGWAEAVITRLMRFRLRTKCELTQLRWQSVSLRGPQSAEIDVTGAEFSVAVEWAGVPGVDAFGPGVSVSDDVAQASSAAFTALRIEAGEPQMGAELDENTIPAAAGIVDRSVSFTKGCYTGQELVARIDSRGGNVPQRLVGVTANVAFDEGTSLVRDGKTIGRVTSAAWSATLDRHVGLAYLARSVDNEAVAAGIEVDSDASDLMISLHPLPLVGDMAQ